MNRQRLNRGKKVSVLSAFLRKILNKGKSQFTIMVAPHDVSRVFQLRVSLMVVWIGTLVLAIMIIGVCVFSMGWFQANRWVKQTDSQLQQAQASMAVIRSDIGLLRHRAEIFQGIVGGVSSQMGRGESTVEIDSGDLSSVQRTNIGSEKYSHGLGQESVALKEVISIFDQIEPGLNTIYGNFEAQQDMFEDMPTRWPIGGSIGYITQHFGSSRDPFTYEWQFHTGLDIALSSGTPIVVAASGTVVKSEYHRTGYGFYVVVRHRYGFYTLYAHMQRYVVHVGQELKQGDLLGYMGSSGRVTGPHLHFEVRIGTEVVDPMKYLLMLNLSSGRGRRKMKAVGYNTLRHKAP